MVAVFMRVALMDHKETGSLREWAEGKYAQCERVTAAWPDAGEFAAAVMAGTVHAVPARDVEEMAAYARRIADASGCSYADALQGAYQMAQVTVTHWPGAAAFADDYLADAVASARAQLRVTGIEITSMDQLDQVTAAYSRAASAGLVPEGFLPPGARAAYAAQAPGRRGRRPGRRPDLSSQRGKMR